MAWEFNPFTATFDKTPPAGTTSVTLQPDVGTSPVGDVFTLTSSDGSIVITGNSATDTLNFQASGFSSQVLGPASASDNAMRRYRDWETDRKSTRLNSSHRL